MDIGNWVKYTNGNNEWSYSRILSMSTCTDAVVLENGELISQWDLEVCSEPEVREFLLECKNIKF